jgi:hypothetical protein
MRQKVYAIPGVAHWGFEDTHVQALGGRFLKLAGANVISDSEAVHVEEAGDDALGNLLLKIFPDEILFAGELGDGGEAAGLLPGAAALRPCAGVVSG